MGLDVSEKNINKNIALGVIYKPISMVLSYIYVPIVLTYLGTEKYGLWATILNVLSWINMFDIGIGNGLRNKLSVILADDNQDEKLIRKYVSSAYIMLSAIIACVLLVVFLSFGFINWNAIFGVKDSYEEDLEKVMLVSTFFMCISFVMAICKSIYRALQQNHVSNLMAIFQQVLMLLSVGALTKITTGSLLWVAILYGISNIIVEVIFTVRLFLKNRAFIPSFRYFSKDEAKDTTNLGILFFVVQIAALVLYTTDNLIITHVMGPAEVTSYTTANKLFSMITGVFAIVIAPYWSAITAMKAKKDWKRIDYSTKKMTILWGIASFGCLALACVFKPIVSLWLGQELYFQKGLIPLMAIYAIIYMWNAVFSQLGNGLELMKVSVILAIVQGVVNIPLSILFAVKCQMSTVGVLLGTVISMGISAVVMPISVYRYRKNDILK